MTVKEVDDETNRIFDRLVEMQANNQREQKNTPQIQDEIERRLTEIYSLTTNEIDLVYASESAIPPNELLITTRSELVSS